MPSLFWITGKVTTTGRGAARPGNGCMAPTPQKTQTAAQRRNRAHKRAVRNKQRKTEEEHATPASTQGEERPLTTSETTRIM